MLYIKLANVCLYYCQIFFPEGSLKHEIDNFPAAFHVTAQYSH